MTEKLNTASSGPASDPPGMLQIANVLSTGIAAQTVAYAELSHVLGKYSSDMSLYAKEEDAQGQKMVEIQTALKWVSGILTGISIVAPIAAVGAAFGASIFSSAGATIVSRAIAAGSEGLQGLGSIGQGGLQVYQTDITSQVEKFSTGVDTFSKTTDTDTDAIQSLSRGAGTTGGQINSMIDNENSVANQRFG